MELENLYENNQVEMECLQNETWNPWSNEINFPVFPSLKIVFDLTVCFSLFLLGGNFRIVLSGIEFVDTTIWSIDWLIKLIICWCMVLQIL